MHLLLWVKFCLILSVRNVPSCEERGSDRFWNNTVEHSGNGTFNVPYHMRTPCVLVINIALYIRFQFDKIYLTVQPIARLHILNYFTDTLVDTATYYPSVFTVITVFVWTVCIGTPIQCTFCTGTTDIIHQNRTGPSSKSCTAYSDSLSVM